MIKATINGTLRNHDIRAQDAHSHKVTQNEQNDGYTWSVEKEFEPGQ